MDDNAQLINGVRYLSPRDNSFSTSYVELRKKEGRLLSDEEVSILPDTDITNPNRNEWVLRKRSTLRFIRYLKAKGRSLSVLDVGCGNGWFSHKMASASKGISVVGLDINEMELEQAVRVFNSHNIEFVYGDLFEIGDIFYDRFDIITLNASVQYFKDLDKLFGLLKRFLRSKGEIHIIDSPFYKYSNIDAAKERTQDYYTKMGVPEMGVHYFHHSHDCVNEFKVMYRPPAKIIRRVFRLVDSPFLWLRYIDQDNS